MKFAHLADVHIGAWRDPRLARLPNDAFDHAVMVALSEGVDFIVIAGDLFHSALPGIDLLRGAVRSLQRAKEQGVPVYVIPGSHDFSPSGKSMLHVLEDAGLVVNVFRGSVVDGKLRLSLTVDEKTGAVVTGILGRRGMLDRQEYEDLDREWLEDQLRGVRFSVFLFHTALDELKPADLSMMSSVSVSLLPRGFHYYAGGHVHVVSENPVVEGFGHVYYPGPVFPASFSELESLRHGSMVLYDDGHVRRVPLVEKEVVPVSLSVDRVAPREVRDRLDEAVRGVDVSDKIVLVRVSGVLVNGSVADIDVKGFIHSLYDRGAYCVLRNLSGLSVLGSDGGDVDLSSPRDIEEKVFSARVSGLFGDREGEVARRLLRVLSSEKRDGETKSSYDERIRSDALRVLGLVDDS